MGKREDFIELNERLNSLARTAMEAMKTRAALEGELLRVSGHHSNAQAVLVTFQYYREQMDVAIKAYLKKYPN